MAFSVPFVFSPNTLAQSAQVNADMNALVAAANNLQGQITALNVLLPPLGRLAPISATPVPSANASNIGTLYYTPHIGASVPIYNGTATASYTFTQQSLVLDASDHLSGSLYDVFAYLASGVVNIGTAPAWTNTTTRSAATSLTRLNGFLVNANSATLTNNSAGVAVLANQATYLGTIYCNGNAQVTMSMTPAAASGGTANILGIYNAYNRVPISAVCLESASVWTPSSANTWQPLNGSNADRITVVDGLGQSYLRGSISCGIGVANTNTNFGCVGVALDSTSATPGEQAYLYSSVVANGFTTSAATPFTLLPQLGLHYIQGMQYGSTLTTNAVVFGANSAMSASGVPSAAINLIVDL